MPAPQGRPRRLAPVRRSHASNVTAKTLIEGAGRIFNPALALFGARVLGPLDWGRYWTAFGAAQWLNVAADFGGHLTLARRTARDGARRRWLGTSLRFKTTLTLAAALIALAATRLPGPAAALSGSFGWLAAGLLALSWTEWLGAWLRGLGRVAEESVLLAIDSALAFGCGAAALALGAGPAGLAASQLLAHGLLLAVALRWARPQAGPARDLAAFARDALPTGLAILLSAASWRLGQIVIHADFESAHPATATAAAVISPVALYAVAHRALEALRFLPAAAAGALFPALAARRGLAPERVLPWLVGFGLLAALAGTIPDLARTSCTLLLGDRYAEAGPPLQVLLWSLPFLSVNALLTQWLVARGRVWTNAGLSLLHLTVHALALGTWHGGGPFAPHVAADVAAALTAAEAALCAGALACWWRFRHDDARRD